MVDKRAGRKVLNRGVGGAIREYFLHHPGTEVTLSELREAYPSFSEVGIRNAISQLKSESFAIETVSMGRIWRYRPAAKERDNSKRVFEELAVTKTGDVLIQDEEGKVYRAVEL